MNQIGITERGDPVFDPSWIGWVREGKPAILITKSPHLLLETLSDMHGNSINVIVHATVTGYGGTILEPNVPKPKVAMQGYEGLIDLLGYERVVLRIDPIIITEKGLMTARTILASARKIAQTRVRISFLDLYPHVIKRFTEAGIPLPHKGFHASKAARLLAYRSLNHITSPWKTEICGEPDLPVTGCISLADCQTLNVQPMEKLGTQRPTCACFGNKLELLSSKSQCEHKCLYCYWRK